MDSVLPLSPDQLAWTCDPVQLGFQTTDDLEDLEEVIGQDRALDAVRFGVGMRQEGYNLFVLGPSGTGKRTIVGRLLERRSAEEPTPSDWCYVENFEHSHKPRTLEFPAGRGRAFQQDMNNLIDDLGAAIPAALEAEEHLSRVEEIEREAKARHDQAFQELAKKARSQGIQLVSTPGGFALAPIRDGEVLSPEEFEKLPQDEQSRIEAAVKVLQQELKEIVEQVPYWRKETRAKIKELNREVTGFAIGNSIAQVKEKYEDLPAVLSYLESVEADFTENADQFSGSEQSPAVSLGLVPAESGSFDEYTVNLVVDNSQTGGAPVVYEDHPNYQNLLGRVEHRSQMGTLLTDFTLIKAGALHRANGGYLVIDALRVLQQPFAWEGLKRALLAREIKIESLAESLSLASTISLEPAAIPLDVKVVLLGERMLYYLLYQYDRDFAELFKVAADFEDELNRSQENCQLYGRLIATLVRREHSRPFDASAVARVIEHSARVAEDSEKLTTHMRTIADLLCEANYWASSKDASTVNAHHVEQAIDQQIRRAGRIKERVQEEIQRGTLLIDTEKATIGQVNGLSVLDLGNYRFGRPSRITATSRLGKGEVVDIERETELGGAIHSKGVLILSSFLASRYAKSHPLSLSASLVFEQSYGLVDGDSASVGELCALLSSLAEAPIKQSLAITGSVNQHGQVQPIGGVNEKLEGFFDVCRQRGLDGTHGVLIPQANVKHLMLRKEVVEAAREGNFHIFPITRVDQAIKLLTGVAAGEPDEQGQFPPGSINQRVSERLLSMFELRREYNREIVEKSNG